MILKVLRTIIIASLALAASVALYVFAPFAAAQNAPMPDAQTPQLDYEFFKTRVEPIFLKRRSPDHARCYVCHQMRIHTGGPLSLQPLLPGMSFWTEEQSRMNFETVSKLVVPGDPSASLFLQRPLAPEAGGIGDTHQGGRQFASQDDPDWQNMKAWVLGQKAGSSAAQ